MTCRRSIRWFPVVVALVSIAGCGGGTNGGTDGGTAATSEVAVDGWCEFVVAFEAGDSEVAKRAFHGRLHDPLHVLAQDVTSVDRGVAARLLEAKSKVEQAFSGGALVASDVTDLETAIASALTTLDRAPLESCVEEGT